MKFLISLTLLLSISLSNITSKLHDSNKKPLFTKDSLDKLRATAPYEVYSYEEHPFKDYTLSQLKQMLGANIESTGKRLPKTLKKSSIKDIPNYFNTLEQWPNCRIEVKNQGHCGSCWAFAATEVLSDRYCIESDGKTNVDLSPQDLVSCDYLNSGCNGGNLYLSWLSLKYKGVVTDSCLPYTSGEGVLQSCKWFYFKCEDNTPVFKYYAKDFYNFESIDEIKQNMILKGPVEAAFQIYQDFMSYKSGIYVRNSDEKIGGHAVKVVGWGTQENEDYWIAQNSWGSDWAENGFFRIKIGECEFENQMIAGDAYFK